VATFASRRPDHDDHPTTQMAKAKPAKLAIVAPVINEIDGSSSEQFGGILEIQPALRQGPLALGGVVADLHSAEFLNWTEQRFL
jgi:hypothetical protein